MQWTVSSVMDVDHWTPSMVPRKPLAESSTPTPVDVAGWRVEMLRANVVVSSRARATTRSVSAVPNSTTVAVWVSSIGQDTSPSPRLPSRGERGRRGGRETSAARTTGARGPTRAPRREKSIAAGSSIDPDWRPASTVDGGGCSLVAGSFRVLWTQNSPLTPATSTTAAAARSFHRLGSFDSLIGGVRRGRPFATASMSGIGCAWSSTTCRWLMGAESMSVMRGPFEACRAHGSSMARSSWVNSRVHARSSPRSIRRRSAARSLLVG